MPRIARIKKGEYCTYHIIQRGNERSDIFRDDSDKRRFLYTLERAKEKYGFKLYGYCLMDNHMHLIIDSHGSDISKVMKSINVSYVIYFNKTYSRCGHLFQDRFKSEVVDDDSYLLELTRYIHLNPVRAGMVDDVGEYRWSSHQSYIGREKEFMDLVDTGLVLKLFSGNYSIARREYIRFVSRGDDVIHDRNGSVRMPIDYPELENEYFPTVYDLGNVEELIARVAAENNIDVSDLTRKKTLYIEVRNKAITEVRRQSNLSLRQIGQLFGGLSESAVSKIVRAD